MTINIKKQAAITKITIISFVQNVSSVPLVVGLVVVVAKESNELKIFSFRLMT